VVIVCVEFVRTVEVDVRVSVDVVEKVEVELTWFSFNTTDVVVI